MPARGGNRGPALLLAAGLTAVGLAETGCGPAVTPVKRALHEYLQAVQREDLDEVYCRSAGARSSSADEAGGGPGRTEFEGWLRGEYDRYLAGRREGEVDLEASPVVLTKAFALGKGTFYTIDAVRFQDEDTALVDMDVRFAYGEVDVAGLSPGTTFYLCGPPPGTIHAVRIPRTPSTESRVVLETIRVRWTLLREAAAAGCPEGWSVHSARPVPGSETTRRITWIF